MTSGQIDNSGIHSLDNALLLQDVDGAARESERDTFDSLMQQVML